MWEPAVDPGRRTGMNGNRKRQLLLPLAALLALAACSDGGGSGADETPTGDEAVVYQGRILVLQQEEHESAGMCTIVAESYPPQCEGIPVVGWDWEVGGHEDVAGTRWGSYIVTGTYDGEAFTLTEEAEPVDDVAYPHLHPAEPEFGVPAEDLTFEELEANADELSAEFPDLVYLAHADEEHGVTLVTTVLLTPELEAYAAEHFPEDTVEIQAHLVPLEA